MDTIEIKDTANSPGIILNPKSGVFRFTGRSLPEDPFEFYDPVIHWFERYQSNPISGARFEFRMTYFNTASSKVFFSIFQIIDQVNTSRPEMDNKVLIFANNDDEDLIELFEYYKELLTTNCLELRSF